MYVFYIEFRGKLQVLIFHFIITLFSVIYQVHFIDTNHQMRNLKQRSDIRMTQRLFDDAITRIYQNQSHVGGGSAGNHIAGILNVSRSVGNDKFAFGCGEITVSHVYGNTLFAFGTQTVGEQC